MEHQHQMQVVRSDEQEDSQILLFYVDENGGTEENVLTTVDHVEGFEGMETMESIPESQVMETEQTYYIEASAGDDDDQDDDLIAQYNPDEDIPWDESEVKRLLVFYNDNKETFTNGLTRKKVLWSVACKTMLTDRTPASCEVQLMTLRAQYTQILLVHKNGSTITWPFIELAHQAFHDDPQVQIELTDQKDVMESEDMSEETKPLEDSKPVVKEIEVEFFQPQEISKPNTNLCTQKKPVPSDDRVVLMLQLYAKHSSRLKKFQKNFNHKVLWETIVLEMGEKDTEYWHHRFHNFKQHYIRLLDKKIEQGDKADISWPYLEYFDKLFLDDPDFRKKYISPIKTENLQDTLKHVWNDAEMTVLVKYYFDCYSEFQDKTIPKNFLWNEVGRLLDKEASACHTKYTQLRMEHLSNIVQGNYDFKKRKPVQILLDNVICRDVEICIDSKVPTVFKWEGFESGLVELIHDNMVIFKDLQGYFVMFAVAGYKFKTSVENCFKKWSELRSDYQAILDDKRDNPEILIDWAYMDVFDRIFDYGVDLKMLTGYENLKAKNAASNEKSSETEDSPKSDQESKGYKARSKQQDGESKAIEILEFYQKHKEKFVNNPRKKQALWEKLAKKIGISAAQCAHRFRNLKQVYTGYVEKEITRSDLPIAWPYYQLCKKVFGYRALKNHLRSKLALSEDGEWSGGQIAQLLRHLAQGKADPHDDTAEQWARLAEQLGKSKSACREKFVDLRKCYRKLKTKITRNPSVNITWKYYNILDAIYSSDDGRCNIDSLLMADDEIVDEDVVADDEYQCIIVMPEGEEVTVNIENAEQPTEPKKPFVTKWNKKTKKRLLTLYLKYVKTHKNEEIISKEMWREIAGKLPNKTPLSCRKMFAKLKSDRLNATNGELHKNTPYYALLEDIIQLKPKFKKVVKDNTLGKEYKDVPMPKETVQKALEYYLKNVDEFANPRFEKKYAWTDLAKEVNQPLNKIFNKINYLKNNKTDQYEYAVLLKQIKEKEEGIKNDVGEIKDDQNEEVVWSDDETEQLLVWYLANLDKFKNPKFVRKYLWIEASSILNKSALSCSKQMSEIRTQYRTLVKEKPEELANWRFNVLCQKIYGTGKQKS